ncbi:hypothetical protein COO59_07570 [Mixta theicola]|uniref:Tlde1 domain-containing protein n=1 Tax=Mixta theicola TaxID=1458355 RepID=A0A2K1QBE8_9GAMM|nr:DUF2778 domain-containing protein [Mixta theicola]PNS12353.1 hypothetical protein COO59_07570 [Mixta theicola]GLR08110.1 hypothetical protein GCM10007905_08290 [Mixta theicola]
MALYGKFVINEAQFAPLIMYGVGTFMAFSGDQNCRNQSSCISVPDKGPLPPGKYWIVDRPRGGKLGQLWLSIKDNMTFMMKHSLNHNEWFALYRDDTNIDDFTWVSGVKRGLFRLHPLGPSQTPKGCITFQHHSDFMMLRNALLNTSTVPINTTGLHAYGYINVVTI